MSKILITGNGFDLFHHLPTKYHHFISIMQTIEGNQYDTDVSFGELFGRVFKIKHQFEYDLIEENYNTANIKFDYEKLNSIKQFLETNLWYKHFKNVTEIETWIDFESEIENVLTQVSILLGSETIHSKKYNQYKDLLIDYTFFNLFGLIEQKFVDKNVISIPEKYLDKRKREIKGKDMLSDLAKSFEDFIVIFNRYLVDIVSVFYSEKKQKFVIPFHSVNEVYTFNYTPTLEKIYNVDKSKIVYLHGLINEDCQKQNLVLGVSEISEEIKVNKAYDFTKYHQKIIKRTNEKFIDVPKSFKSSSSETVFYIIGHSLDESDKEYIIDLFKFLEFDNDRLSKICVFCYDKRDEINKLKNLLSIINKDFIVEMHKNRRLYFITLNNENIIKEFSNELYVQDGLEIQIFG